MEKIHFDLITLGRVSMDLFSLNIGAPFTDIEAFDTGVGGSPTNIAIGSARLGLKVAALTAVGEDRVGDFVLKFLQQNGVETQYIPRKADARTGLALLGIQPPDRFPLVFYRENPADVLISIDDVLAAPLTETRALLLSGTALSRGPCRDATLFAAEMARSAGATVFLDLDLRPDQWTHPRAYGVNIRTLLPHVDVAIGTEEELYAALAPDPDRVMRGTALGDADRAVLDTLLEAVRNRLPDIKTIVIKRGARGVTVLPGLASQAEPLDVPGFPVEVLNTVGAGDAFASGLIYGYLQGWDWRKAARMANACGALVVTRHGCAKAMPYLDELMDFIATHGGW